MLGAILIVLGFLGIIQGYGWAGLAAIALWALIYFGGMAGRGRVINRSDGNEAGDSGSAAHSATAPDVPARRPSHFERHAATPGWIYVARNDLHAPDLYKVGYTTVGPKARLRTLNEQGQGVTVAVGEFRMLHSRRVPRSYTAEQMVFKRLDLYRARQHREFFQAPLAAILQAVDAVADELDQRKEAAAACLARVSDTCPKCGVKQSYEAMPIDDMTYLYCRSCEHAWSIGVRWSDDGSDDDPSQTDEPASRSS